MIAKIPRATLVICGLAAGITAASFGIDGSGAAKGAAGDRPCAKFERHERNVTTAPTQGEGAWPRGKLGPLSEAKKAAKEQMDKAYQAYEAAEAHYKWRRDWNFSMSGRAIPKGVKPCPLHEAIQRVNETKRAYDEARRNYEKIPD